MPVIDPREVDDIEHWYGSSKRAPRPAVRGPGAAPSRGCGDTVESAGASPATPRPTPPEAPSEAAGPAKPGGAPADGDWPFVAS